MDGQVNPVLLASLMSNVPMTPQRIRTPEPGTYSNVNLPERGPSGTFADDRTGFSSLVFDPDSQLQTRVGPYGPAFSKNMKPCESKANSTRDGATSGSTGAFLSLWYLLWIGLCMASCLNTNVITIIREQHHYCTTDVSKLRVNRRPIALLSRLDLF